MRSKLPLWLGLSLLLVSGTQASADDAALKQPRSVAPGGPETSQLPNGLPPAAVSEPLQPPRKAGAGLPLAPPRERASGELTAPRMPGSSTTITTVVSSLAVVLGLFFVLAWFMRRNLPKAMTQLPSEVLEQLGRAPLAGKQQMHLVRVGQKLVLLVVTPFGAEAVTEITDPDEVDRLCGICRQSSGHGPSAEFRAVLRQFEREPAPPGFLGDTARTSNQVVATNDTGRKRRWGGLHAEA